MRVIGVADAAKILGISVSTLKRMCDEGLVPTERTSGGHRRFGELQIREVARRLGKEAVQYLPDARFDTTGRLRFMLLAGHDQGVASLLNQLSGQPASMPRVLDEFFLPALLSLPSRGASPEQLTLAERTAGEVLDRLFLDRPRVESTEPLAVGVSAGSTCGEIASKLVEVSLSYCGVSARSLGCVVSGQQLHEELIQLKPAVVWLAIIHDQAFSDLVTLSQLLRGKLAPETQLVIYSGCRSLSTHARWNIDDYFMSLEALCTQLSPS